MSRLAAAFALALIASPAPAQQPPAKSMAGMKTADGLQVELFAAEPMLVNPTAIDVDPAGRVWVAEAVNYRRVNFNRPILRPEGDRIVVLTDKDGDGKADESVVFYQGKELYGPLSVLVRKHPNGPGQTVYVAQSPDILQFEDVDGDLKADGPPKKFLTGFGGFDHDHGVHGLTWGPDGKLYFTVGDAGVTGLQSSDKAGKVHKSNTTDCRAGTVWRCDADGKNVELIAHNFRNNYEACVDSFGEIWLSDNDDDGNQQTRICHVMPGGNYGYHPRGAGQSHWHEEQPGIVHKTLRTGFGSPTGICVYEGDLLPAKYKGQLLHCDAGPREFRAFLKKPNGAGYTLDKELLVTNPSDNWFRLSDCCVAPDGSVLLSDWYDPGVGGHGMGDWKMGRIYRVTPKGHVGYKVPAAKLDTPEGVRAALASPNVSTRAAAQDTLAAMPTDAAKATLTPLMKDAVAPQTRARALWMVSRLVPPQLDVGTSFLPGFESAGADDKLRLVHIRAAADLLRAKGQSFADRAPYWVNNDDPAVRRELLLALRSDPADKSKDAFYALAKKYDGKDIFYRAALNICAGTDAKHRDALLSAFPKAFPTWTDASADLVWELRPSSLVPHLESMLADAKLPAGSKAKIVDILAGSDSPAVGTMFVRRLADADLPADVRARMLENVKLFLPGKWAALKKEPATVETAKTLLGSDATAPAGLALAAATQSPELVPLVVAKLDPKTPVAVRRAAAEALGNMPSKAAVDALVAALNSDVAAEAAPALAKQIPNRGETAESKAAFAALLGVVTAKDSKDDARLAALSAFGGTRPGATYLIDAKQKGTLAESLFADAGRLMRNTPYQDLRNKAVTLFPAPGKLDPKKLPAVAVLAKRKGDAAKGEKILQASLKGETQCLRCHTVQGTGGAIGPDLSMVGKKAAGKENLLDSILYPSKAVSDQYIQWTVETADGASTSGLLVEESKDFVTLRAANGKDVKIKASDIEGGKRKSAVSLMPEGLVATLTEDELIDLVEYMLTLQTPVLAPDYLNILGPFANDQEDSALATPYPPESKVDLAATLKGKGGKPVAWGKVRPGVDGYFDLAAHHADASVHSMSYLFREVAATKDGEVTFRVGNDDGCIVWVNGQQVFANKDHFAAKPNMHSFKAKLKAGPNEVLVKIVNGNNPHGFYMNVLSEEELKLGK